LHMGLISLLWGIVAMIWMIVALIPLLGLGNWFLIPFAAVGALIAAIGVLFTAPGNRGRAKTGLALNGLVIVVGVVWLMVRGGVVWARRVPCPELRGSRFSRDLSPAAAKMKSSRLMALLQGQRGRPPHRPRRNMPA